MKRKLSLLIGGMFLIQQGYAWNWSCTESLGRQGPAAVRKQGCDSKEKFQGNPNMLSALKDYCVKNIEVMTADVSEEGEKNRALCGLAAESTGDGNWWSKLSGVTAKASDVVIKKVNDLAGSVIDGYDMNCNMALGDAPIYHIKSKGCLAPKKLDGNPTFLTKFQQTHCSNSNPKVETTDPDVINACRATIKDNMISSAVSSAVKVADNYTGGLASKALNAVGDLQSGDTSNPMVATVANAANTVANNPLVNAAVSNLAPQVTQNNEQVKEVKQEFKVAEEEIQKNAQQLAGLEVATKVTEKNVEKVAVEAKETSKKVDELEKESAELKGKVDTLLAMQNKGSYEHVPAPLPPAS